ncbi:MAG: enoyl-CoA hydratase/isomerase family protein [Deferribacteres bacterium]|nr:enoyl-CoA hydratase/isomerase family protein [candidate division KSB1 bacterium]MCB9510782.1 enoyl-CoA hydratase/isomerase family protein [Deferribacteres bacterium]
MSDAPVSFSKSGNIGTITLNRPPANSYEMEFMQAMDAAIDAANRDAEVKVVILKSASEKFFCAGADIKAFMANDTPANMKMVATAHKALGKMADSPKVFIAAINGHALGGGLEIALACDLRYAAEGDYRMGLPEVTLGLLSGNGGTQRLPRLIGANKALELMLTGSTFTPADALQYGVVNKLFPADQLFAEVEKIAGRLANGASLAIANIKKAVYQGIELDLQDGLKVERELVEPLFNSKDAAEGLTAFVEKRKAVFQGQ